MLSSEISFEATKVRFCFGTLKKGCVYFAVRVSVCFYFFYFQFFVIFFKIESKLLGTQYKSIKTNFAVLSLD